MSRFTIGDLVKLMVDSCYRTSSRRSEDTATKLEFQSKMHDSRIRVLERHLKELDLKKMNYVASKNIPMAKKTVVERHKVNLRKIRCEQLKDCCDRYLESINEFDSVKETVGALNEAKTTFKHINIEDIGLKVGEISDVVADFRAELSQTQNALSDMGGGMEISDQELKAELDALDALDLGGAEAQPAVLTPLPVPLSTKSTPSVAGSEARTPSEVTENEYTRSGIFA